VPYRVYVIQNGDARFYIGLSDDVVRRINQHNVGDSRLAGRDLGY
jgi:predicted GIY-YIG superfamily endonuclease